MKHHSPHATGNASFGSLWFCWVVFVVYGSLVPLNYVPMHLDAALEMFKSTPMLRLGIESRADWVANGVLYLPVGFLTAGWWCAGSRGALKLLIAAIALAFGCALAVGVEFTQLFFPGRTVSLNDIAAECIGSAVGVLLALRWSAALRNVLLALRGNTRHLLNRLLGAYLVAYVGFAFFPYDLLLSWQEINAKWASHEWGWLVASDAVEGNVVGFVAKLLAEVLMAVPLGAMLSRWRGGRGAPSFTGYFCVGAAFGLLIEFAQFFIASGISQGASVLTRALGVGVWSWVQHTGLDFARVRGLFRRWAGLLWVVYLFALLAVSGWSVSGMSGLDTAMQRLFTEVRFMPFYYHYFTTEAKALFSLVSVMLLYAPVGVLSWGRGSGAVVAGLLAAVLASLVEAGKLFFPETHPDPTNVLIAAAAAWAVVKMADLMLAKDAVQSMQPGGGAVSGLPPLESDMAPAESVDATRAAPARASGRIWLAGVAGLLSIAWLLNFPTQRVLLGALFAAYAFAVWRRPVFVFAAVGACLPLLDLAHWSGRLFFDEFDVLVLLGASIAYARTPSLKHRTHDLVLALAVGGVLLSLAASTWMALSPWPAQDFGTLSSYLSPFNALRIAKGALWAVLLWLLMRRFDRRERVRASFSLGVCAGLVGTVIFVLWERLSFTSLLDFSTEYRVTGLFFAMHTGGAYIECFLVVAAPFVLMEMLNRESWTARVACALALVGGCYAIMVCYSRGGYAAFAIALVVFWAFSLLNGARRRKAIVAGVVAGVIGVVVAAPVLSGSFAKGRIGQVESDLGTRESHWDRVSGLRNPGLAAELLGTGIGRFPASFFWQSSAEGHPLSSHRIVQEGGASLLRLGAGETVYVEQLVDLDLNQSYALRVRWRGAAGSQLSVSVCEKWQLYPLNCGTQTWSSTASPPTMMTMEKEVGTGLSGPGRQLRSHKLAVYNTGTATVDLADIQLVSGDGLDLLANGNFAQGLDHWTFSADNHLAWHIHNLPLAVFFDQGWLGVLSVGVLLGLGLCRAGRSALRQDLHAAATCAALVSFLFVGFFDSLVDNPRFLMLLLFLALMGATREKQFMKVRRDARASASRVPTS